MISMRETTLGQVAQRNLTSLANVAVTIKQSYRRACETEVSGPVSFVDEKESKCGKQRTWRRRPSCDR